MEAVVEILAQLELFESDSPWIAAAIVLAMGLVIAVAVAALINWLARRLLGDSTQAGRIAGATFYVLAAVAVVLALGRLTGPRTTQIGLTEATTRFLARLPDVLIGLLVLVLGWVLAITVRNVLRRVLGRFQPVAADILAPVAFWGVLTLAVLVAADQAGIEVRFLQALLLILVAGLVLAAALALGLGTRDLIAEVVAGRHAARIVGLGDEIEVAHQRGTVVALGHASVRVSVGEHEVEIPNRRFLDDVVVIVRRGES